LTRAAYIDTFAVVSAELFQTCQGIAMHSALDDALIARQGALLGVPIDVRASLHTSETCLTSFCITFAMNEKRG